MKHSINGNKALQMSHDACLKAVLTAALAIASALPFAAQAQEPSWLVRVRAVNLASENKDSTGLGLSINDKVLPELDISYFFTPQLSVELVLTYPQGQDIRSNGTKIGSLHHLPPTLSAQYHFVDFGAFVPYVGAGVNWTRFSRVTFDTPVADALSPSLEKNSFGPSVQVGFDYNITKSTVFNFDIKKVMLRTDVRSFGTKVGTLKVDPWLIGAGFGWRF